MPARGAFRDDPWARLAWLLPTAVSISVAAIVGFLALLSGPPIPPRLPAPVEVEVVELPPAAPAEPEPPPPLPPRAEPQPPPIEEPEPPPPEPQIELAPPPSPPPPAPPPRRPHPPPRTARPSTAAPSSPTPPSAAAPAPAPAVPTGGNTAGARAIYQPLPQIPEELRHRAVELVAVARFRVAPDGSAEVELMTPTPDPAFNRLLLEALRKWRFFPKIESGKPVASAVDIRIPISVR